jgi:hypothetical protein
MSDLWTDTEIDDLNHSRSRQQRRSNHIDGAARHIGCPLWWFKLVFPIVRGKNELAVALYVYRLRIIRRSRTVVISNAGLLTELGIDRYAKYRALSRLASAGIVQIRRHNKRALKVVFCQKRGRGSR